MAHVWRGVLREYADRLGVTDASTVVTLGEGGTPLLPAPSLSRRTGAGRELMREAVARTAALWPGRAIRIGAQRYLERFYGEFGFVQDSEPYDEDGIPHIEMVRRADKENDA